MRSSPAGSFDATRPIPPLDPNRFAQSSGNFVAGQIQLDSQRFFSAPSPVIEQPANDNKVRRFADSWRVPEPESLVSVGETPVPVPEVAEAPLEPEDLDPAAVEEAQQACEGAGVDDQLAIETSVYDVAATGNEEFVDSSATLQVAVEELPDSAPEPVFATEEPDLVPNESSSSFPWILIAAIAVVIIVLIVVLVARANSKKKTQGGPPANPPASQGAGPPAGGAPGSGV